MERILFFDGTCRACAPLARAIDEMQLPGLTTRSLNDPEVADLLGQAGLAVPAKPAMLCIDGRLGPRLSTGIRMRVELAQLIGIRNSRKIVRLAVAEVRAHAERSMGGRGTLSRRHMLTVTGGAATGLTLLGATGRAGAEPQDAIAVAADADLVEGLLRISDVRKAVDSFGAVDATNAIRILNAGEPIVAFGHADSTVVTFVGLAPRKPPLVLAYRPLSNESGFEYLTPAGKVMAAVVYHEGTPQVRPYQPEPSPVTPNAVDFACFVACVGGNVSADCFSACVGCAFGSVIIKAILCPICAACSAGLGVRCARECSD